MSKRLKFLTNIESTVIDRLPQLEQQDVALVTHVYALYGYASTLFYLDLERFLGFNVQNFSSEVLADLINSVLLVHHKMRSKLLDAFETVLPRHQFTVQQAIKILRAFEFMGRSQFEGKESLLSVMLEAKPQELTVLEQLQALEIIHANYYLNRLEAAFTEALNHSIPKTGWNLSKGRAISMDEPANLLACLGDHVLHQAIKPENYLLLNNYIRLSVAKGKPTDVSLVVAALHRFDQAWDHGLWDRKSYITILEPIIQALNEVSGNVKANLTMEEKLFLSNMLAKVCHHPWNALASSLLAD